MPIPSPSIACEPTGLEGWTDVSTGSGRTSPPASRSFSKARTSRPRGGTPWSTSRTPNREARASIASIAPEIDTLPVRRSAINTQVLRGRRVLVKLTERLRRGDRPFIPGETVQIEPLPPGELREGDNGGPPAGVPAQEASP